MLFFSDRILTVSAIKMYKRGRLSSVSIIGRRLILPLSRDNKELISDETQPGATSATNDIQKIFTTEESKQERTIS